MFGNKKEQPTAVVYCPFFYNPGGLQGKAGCLKEGCTFWLPEAEQCSIPVLARQALGLSQESS